MKGSCILVVFLCYMFPRGVANAQYLGNDYIEEDPRNVLTDFDQLRTLVQKYAVNDDREIRRNINDYDDELKNWTGQWLPHRPNDPTVPPKVFPKVDQTTVVESSENPHGVPMGNPSKNCDDAKTNLTMDWNGNPINHTCYDKRIVPDRNVIAIKYCERIPEYYVAIHKCMYEEIEYDDNVPVSGPHRPLWPIYGEYKFLPRQRWLHNLEHGAILALYHPCANPMEVKRLKSLLRGCLRRHVISPSNLLDEDRPMALVAWGCRLSMSYVNPKLVIKFIREHALRGPEEIPRDGDFSDGLIRRAEVVSDFADTILCPNARFV